MLTLDEARRRAGGAVGALPHETRPLREALGCRLAGPVAAEGDLPGLDISAMDGYAVRAADLTKGRALGVALEAAAGVTPSVLPPQSAARVFTGAPLPHGADTVVPQQQSQTGADGRALLEVVPKGSHVLRRGEVLTAGTEIAGAGDLVTPQRLGLLAAVGSTKVSVVPRPRVALLVTGNELAPEGRPPAAGQVRDSNGPLLEALAAEAGLPVSVSERVGDEAAALRRALVRALQISDLTVTTGGVSVGTYDLVPAVVDGLGGSLVLHKVAIQPGKPVLLARVGHGWLLGLPGNPVGALVGWRLFGRPLAEQLAGDRHAFEEQPLRGTLLAAVGNSGTRTQLCPAQFERSAGGLSVRVLPWHGSHDVLAAGRCDALARLERGAALATGDGIGIYPLPWRSTA